MKDPRATGWTSKATIVAFALVLTVALFVRIQSPVLLRDLNPRPDSVEYALGARHILDFGRFTITLNGHELPSRYPIGFPLLIIPSYLVFGRELTSGIWTVLVMDLLGIFIVWKLGNRIFGGIAGIVGAALVALSPLDRVLTGYILSDIPSSTITLAAILCVVLLRPSPSSVTDTQLTRREIILLGLTGFFLAFSSWIRQINAVYVPVVLLFAALRYTDFPHTLNAFNVRALRATAIPAIVFALLMMPIFVFNTFTFGSPLRTGYNFWVPYFYDSISMTFSLRYAFDTGHHLLAYLEAMTGYPIRNDLNGSNVALFDRLVPILMIVGLLPTVKFWHRQVMDGVVRSPRSTDEAPGANNLKLLFFLTAGFVVVSTVGLYSLYFAYSPRFLHICVLLACVMAGGGAQWIATPDRRFGTIGVTIAVLAGIVGCYWIGVTAYGAVQDSSIVRERFRHESLYHAYDYELTQFARSTTEDNAEFFGNIAPELFSTYVEDSGRRVFPFKDEGAYPLESGLRPFIAAPDRITDALTRKVPVYLLGDTENFDATRGTDRFYRRLFASRHVDVGDFDLRIYRLYDKSSWLLGQLDRAKIERPINPPEAVTLRKVSLDGREDTVLLEHPTSRVTFGPLVVPDNGHLLFATAIAPDCQGYATGARFSIQVQTTGDPAKVFSREMRPKTNPIDLHWINGQVDLSPWARQSVSISLLTDAIDGDYTCAWALWRDVVIDTSRLPFSDFN